MATFNPAETGLHGPYISRKMRRRAERLKPRDERSPKNTLGNFLQGVARTMPKAAVSQKGYRGGARMLYEIGPRMATGAFVASLRHPTKRATLGRVCFVTVSP